MAKITSQQPNYGAGHPTHHRMTKSFSGLPSLSNPAASSAQNEVVYNGPFLGRARALVDYTPSPYDRDALRFNVSYVLIPVASGLGVFKVR